MENKKRNTMGSEVVEGYVCKPVKLDPNKPIMHFKTNLFLCDGERCNKASKSEDLAGELRSLLKTINLHKGEKRIKISRTNCFGACRFRQVAVVFENTRANGNLENNNVWIKNVHKFSKEQWEKLFLDLSSDKEIAELYETVPMESYE